MKTVFYQLRMLIAENLVYLAVMKIMPPGPAQHRLSVALTDHLRDETDLLVAQRVARKRVRK